MATLTIPNTIADGQDITGTPHAENYAAIAAFVNASVAHLDGSKAMTGELQLVDGNNAASKVYVDDAVGVAVPVGTVLPYAGSIAPSAEWAIPVGQDVSRSTYADLFALIGTTYGAGDGTTTFTLPDMRSKFVASKGAATWSNALGKAGGSKDAVVVSHIHTMPSHSHTVDPANTTATLRNWAGAFVNSIKIFRRKRYNGTAEAAAAETDFLTAEQWTADSTDIRKFEVKVDIDSTSTSSDDPGDTNSAGVAGTDANLPPYITLNYIIKVM